MYIEKLNIHEAKTKLSAILIQMEKTGESVLICRNGKPIAKLVPYHPPFTGRLAYHPEMRDIQINYDPTEVLSGEEWEDLE